ncbi:hypothetical protein PCANB_000566 [Pneumocystis canis]|nr:hypothetical protein PCANB_000566 [Pneumocystis canis]
MKKLKSKYNSNKTISDKVSSQEEDISKISNQVYTLKQDHCLKTNIFRCNDKIKKLRHQYVHLLKKDNLNLAPPMDSSLYNFKYTWLYKKKRIERKNISKFFMI